MAIHDDNWTQEFSIHEFSMRAWDWHTVIPVIVIAVVTAWAWFH